VILAPLVLLASTLHAGPEKPLTPAVADASPYSQRELYEAALPRWRLFTRTIAPETTRRRAVATR
jgi:hypothetical protein